MKYHVMKMYGGVEVQLHAFITPALESHFKPGERTPCNRSDRRLGGSRNRPGRVGEKERIPSYPCWELSTVRPSCILVTILTHVIKSILWIATLNYVN